jgi:hypothetical protein
MRFVVAALHEQLPAVQPIQCSPCSRRNAPQPCAIEAWLCDGGLSDMQRRFLRSESVHAESTIAGLVFLASARAKKNSYMQGPRPSLR